MNSAVYPIDQHRPLDCIEHCVFHLLSLASFKFVHESHSTSLLAKHHILKIGYHTEIISLHSIRKLFSYELNFFHLYVCDVCLPFKTRCLYTEFRSLEMLLKLNAISIILPQILMGYLNGEGGHIGEPGGENGLPIIESLFTSTITLM